MDTVSWYDALIKPFWAPPAWLFGPVWTFLYAVIFISYGYVVVLYFNKRITFSVLLPFILNVFFNVVFSTIQFGLQNNILAAVDIILVLGTLIWAIVGIKSHARWVTYANIPYLLWVCFATVLQITVTILNLK